MTRQPLPNRRNSFQKDIRWGDHGITVGVGLDPANGGIRDVFADAHKGGQMGDTLRDACVLISLGLQNGISARSMLDKLPRVPDLLSGENATLPASPVGAILEMICAPYDEVILQ